MEWRPGLSPPTPTPKNCGESCLILYLGGLQNSLTTEAPRWWYPNTPADLNADPLGETHHRLAREAPQIKPHGKHTQRSLLLITKHSCLSGFLKCGRNGFKLSMLWNQLWPSGLLQLIMGNAVARFNFQAKASGAGTPFSSHCETGVWNERELPAWVLQQDLKIKH